MINLDIENLDSETLLEQFANHHFSVETAHRLWNGRQVSEENVLELEIAAKKIHDILFSCDSESEEFEEIWRQLAAIGESVSYEDYESLGLHDIVHLMPEFEEELDCLANLDTIEFGIFSSIGKKVSSIWKKYKTEIIIGAAVVVVIAITAGAASAAAAAAAGTAGGAVADKKKNDSKPSDSLPVKKQPPPPPLPPPKNGPPSPPKPPEVSQSNNHFPPQALSPVPPNQTPLDTPQKVSLPLLQWNIKPPQEITPFKTNFPEAPKKNTPSNPLPTTQLPDTPNPHSFKNPSLQPKLPPSFSTELKDPLPLTPSIRKEFLDKGLEDILQRFEENALPPKNPIPLSKIEFALGFFKGLPQGCFDSAEGYYSILKGIALQPSETGIQMFKAFSELSLLASSGKWPAISKALVPEVHQLITEWDTLPSDVRGYLAGYAFGKYGADIFIPGAVIKLTVKGVEGAKELARVYKNLQATEQTLLLETAEGVKSGVGFGEGLARRQGALTASEEIAAIEERLNGIACNRAEFERYQAILRSQMEKPLVQDLKLQRLVNQTFKPDAVIGNGSTAAAIRYEKLTGEHLFGKFHSKKGREMIIAFENWIKTHPTAKKSDRIAAENIIKDLKNALG